MGRTTEVIMVSEPLNKEMICKDCVHGYVKWDDLPNYWLFGGVHWMKCKRTGKLDDTAFNPVTGYTKKKLEYKDAWQERNRQGGCGPSAKYWSPKNKNDLFKLLKR